PAQKCQFTLPSQRWSWSDRPVPNVFVSAESKDGLVIQITCAPAAAWSNMDDRAVQDFEASLARSSHGQLKKRSASYVPYHGLTSYQVAGLLPDGRTTVSRFFLAHEMAYQILMVGGKEPVEQHLDFEAIMSGFAFTTPPAPAPPRPSHGWEFT